MAQMPPPLRHRDRNPRLDDYYASDYDRRPRRMSPGPVPRRNKSERQRRPPSPDYQQEPRSSRRQDRDRGYNDRGYDRPSSAYATDSRRDHSGRDSGRRRERDGGDEYRRSARGYDEAPRSRRQDRDLQRDPLDRYGDKYSSRRESPPPPYDKKYSGGDRKYRSGPSSPEGTTSKHRSRELPASYDDKEDYKQSKSSRRPRSQERSKAAPISGGGVGFGSKPTRRNTMPASTGKKQQQWWQNPLLQAGARTAFAAGAQAAMNNRSAQGDWMGAKGAKVAGAALSAALMDGFVNRKDDSPGGGARDDRDGRDQRDSGRDSHKDGGSSKKQGGGMKDKLLRQGFDFVAKQASGRR